MLSNVKEFSLQVSLLSIPSEIPVGFTLKCDPVFQVGAALPTVNYPSDLLFTLRGCLGLPCIDRSLG